MGANIFLLIYRYFKKHRVIFWCCLLLAFAILGFLASRIHLKEDITAIIPQDAKTQQLNAVFSKSKLLDKMIITVSQADSGEAIPDTLVQVVDSFASIAMSRIGSYTASVHWKVDEAATSALLDKIQQQLPLYLDESDYAGMDSLLQREVMRGKLEQQLRLLSSPAGLALKQFIATDLPGIGSGALQKLQQLQYDPQFELYDSHILTRDQRQAVFFITPRYPKNNTKENARLLEMLDEEIGRLQRLHPSVRISYYGGTAVAVGNALQLRRDSLLTQGITVGFLIVFFGLYFRRAAASLLILLPALLGSLFALVGIYLLKGSISVIALGTGSIILGIAVNYSLHVFNHYRHEHDMEQLIRDLSTPMTVGSLTTILGFACLQWVESPLLQDLGLFAALSLTGASISSLIFLPQLIRQPKTTSVKTGENWLDRISNLRFDSNRPLLLFILALTLLFACFVRKVGFEPDMSQMNFMTGKLREAEKQVNILNAFALQSIYVVSEGRDLESALRRSEALVGPIERMQQMGTVKKYTGLQAILVSDSMQQQRIDRWNNFWTTEKKTRMLNLLQEEGTKLGFNQQAFTATENRLQKMYHPIGDSMALGIGNDLLDNYLIRSDSGVQLLTLIKATPEDKTAVYKGLSEVNGASAIDMQYVTTTLVEMVRKDFNSISWMAAAIVFIVLFVSFGRIELALIAFIPMLISWIWILGIMGLTGMKFNIVNIIISALIFGLGDDYSLFTLDGLLQEYKTGKKTLGSFRSSILLSAITTMAGLGVLLFAKHPSLRSIAGIAIIGIGSVVLVSQVMIPYLFRLLISGRTEKKRFPWTAWYLLTSVFAFGYFFIGALFLSLAGILLLKLNPFAGRRCKYAYHWLLSKFAWTLLHIMGNVDKKLINDSREDFSKPAVIVSNHQSSLDVLTIMMLHPKIILFTNERVWRSPIFGFVVKMADFFPVTRGVEDQLPALKALAAEGYSIAIFPEGTRSPDGRIQRFHKGAFFLAEQLSLDIVPVLLLGTGYTLNKSDFMLKDGGIQVEILPRISATDNRWGTDFGSRTKSIGRYFREEFSEASSRLLTVNWYREQLISNFIYKGPVLEWYMRIKTRLEKNYAVLEELVPKEGKILDLGCGYGFLSYMLHFTGPLRKITGIDYDQEKIAVAAHGFSRGDNLQFRHMSLESFEWEVYDAIFILDVLHYLEPAEQEKIIETAMANLLPGGKLLIRDGNTDLDKRHKGTRFTEWLSTRLFGFNKTREYGLHFLSGRTIHRIAAGKGFTVTELDQTQHTSNIIFVLQKENGNRS